MSAKVLPEPVETLEQRFERLLAQWHKEIGHLSSTTKRRENPAYQEIISLGKPAVPLLLREMERSKNGHLSYALRCITGASPVLPEHRGRIQEIAEDWLRWGKERGYQW